MEIKYTIYRGRLHLKSILFQDDQKQFLSSSTEIESDSVHDNAKIRIRFASGVFLLFRDKVEHPGVLTN